MKTKVMAAFIIICVCCPFHSFAGGIHEEEKVYVDHEDTSSGDTITPTGDLSVPNRVISSIDMNAHGEILVCYDNKIIVFNNEYAPIKAFDVRSGRRGTYPSAVWNQETGRIVYVRGGGYEIDDDGKIVAQYEGIEDTDYRPKRAEGGGVTYKLENRVPLPNLTITYSTLVSVDSGGNKTVLHNATWAQFYVQLNWIVIIIFIIIGSTYLIVKEHKKEKAKEAQGNE